MLNHNKKLCCEKWATSLANSVQIRSPQSSIFCSGFPRQTSLPLYLTASIGQVPRLFSSHHGQSLHAVNQGFQHMHSPYGHCVCTNVSKSALTVHRDWKKKKKNKKEDMFRKTQMYDNFNWVWSQEELWKGKWGHVWSEFLENAVARL